MEASREEAASNALKPLLQMGLDRSNKLKSFEESQASLQGKLKINSYLGRQPGQVIRSSDLKPVGRGFKSHSDC